MAGMAVTFHNFQPFLEMKELESRKATLELQPAGPSSYMKCPGFKNVSFQIPASVASPMQLARIWGRKPQLSNPTPWCSPPSNPAFSPSPGEKACLLLGSPPRPLSLPPDVAPHRLPAEARQARPPRCLLLTLPALRASCSSHSRAEPAPLVFGSFHLLYPNLSAGPTPFSPAVQTLNPHPRRKRSLSLPPPCTLLFTGFRP